MRPLRFASMIIAAFALCLSAHADALRNVEVGQLIPPFTLRSLDGDELRSADLKRRVTIIVYVSAEQRSSTKALQAADAVARSLRRSDLAVMAMTGDVSRIGFFREQRDRLGLQHPFGLDVGRQVYGALGLIVLPTTMIVDREGRLAHVISSYKPDYRHVLDVRVRRALGLIDDQAMEQELATERFERDRPEDRIGRRRAAARLLRENGLVREAENELRAALEIDGAHADTQLDLASLYLDDGNIEGADALVAQVTAAAPDHRRGRLLSGVVLYHRGQLDAAERVLLEALLLNPDPVRTHYYLGLIEEERGDPAAAARHFREALDRLLREHPM